MTSLLIIAVLVLLGIAIWQLTKIFHLTQLGATVREENTEVANDRDNNVNGYLMFGFLGFIYIFTIYSMVKWGHLVLGTPASEHGPQYDNLMAISMWLIFIVQTITQFLLHYFAFKYRGKKDNTAYYYADNDKLEFIWTIIPVVVLAGLILYGLYAWTNIMFIDDDKEEALYVEVYAKQFGWEVRYAGEDGVLGKANIRYIEGINTMGVDMSDPNAQDDITATELHLPKGKKVIFKFRSQDVLHSAYFPHFRAQMNVVPGMVTQFGFTPTITTDEMRLDPAIMDKVSNINNIRSKKSADLIAKGGNALDPYTFDYLLLCNKICGASHYNMQMKVVVDNEADFNKWLSEKKTLGVAVKESQAGDEPHEVEVPMADPANNIDQDTIKATVDSTAVAQNR
ncbi:cytochrome c oxidase subunit II [Flavobacterium salilacus subsp. salilacus]|uniref:cytochrome c oxidase subunit II n=1 Tax=Flavobacterium TaxID=237 RepID=UPI00107529B2|nr:MULTISPECIES: cytochrome c oxidase subunit II [Flavobacterium]KAF2520012.1 cytochrome c oxidase subunit II [Flavobacterium salilacus subsp. salilacus]MBE1614072.1 cytochrome c oxidase subunit II [Flavobacterium sp. SaA2.13]